MAGSVSSQVIHSEGIFVALKSTLITESGRCLCARTWVEHGVNIPYPSTPGWLWLMQTNSFSIEPLRQRWALPCLLSQFIIIILYLNLTQSEQFTQYRSSPDRVGLPFHESDVFCCADLMKINWIKDLIISFFVHPTLHFHPPNPPTIVSAHQEPH